MKVTGQLHAPASLVQGKKPVPVYRKQVGPQSRSRRCGEKEILALTRIFFCWNTLFYMVTYKQHTKRSSTPCRYHTPHDDARAPCNWRFGGNVHLVHHTLNTTYS